MNELQISKYLWRIYKRGAQARRENAGCPYHANTLKSFIHMLGWTKEDLRLGLMKADPGGYGAEQRRLFPEDFPK